MTDQRPNDAAGAASDAAAAAAAIRAAHRFNPRTGNCTCGWEPESDRGAERLHARHVEDLIARRGG